MAGLIEEQMSQPVPEDPVQEEMEPEVEPEDDAALIEALRYVESRLYEDQLGESVAKALASGPDNPRLLAETIYKIVQKADTETGGDIAEENLPYLAMPVMEEVLTIAEEVGVNVTEQLISKVWKNMIQIFLDDHGVDSAGVVDALKAVDDDEFANFARQINEQEVAVNG